MSPDEWLFWATLRRITSVSPRGYQGSQAREFYDRRRLDRFPKMGSCKFDLSLIRQTSPLEGLKYLLVRRHAGLADHFSAIARFSPGDEGEHGLFALVDRLSVPINPLLLATAMSISLVRDQDYHSFLGRYCGGLEAPQLEEDLLEFTDWRDEDELAEILRVEASFVEALVTVGTDIVGTYGSLLSQASEPRKGPTPAAWHVDWGIWVAANPILLHDLKNGCFQRGWTDAMLYGSRTRASIQTTGEHSESLLNEVNGRLQYLLSGQPTREVDEQALRQLRKMQANRSLLLERARRLYDWLPCEIVAPTGAVPTAAHGTPRAAKSDVPRAKGLAYSFWGNGGGRLLSHYGLWDD